MAARARAADVYFEVDEDAMVRALHGAVDRVEQLVGRVAMELADNLKTEGGTIYPQLGETWNVDRGPTQFQARVAAPEEAWWAHFVAGGTKEHGPRRAERMLFEVDGETVAATRVSGVPANPFHERAMARTRSRVDDILRRMIH